MSCCSRNTLCASILATSSLFLAMGLVCAFAVFPAIIKSEVKRNLNLWNLNSEGRKNFEVPPVPVYMKFHMFHVENSVDLMQDPSIKPRFSVKGPYSYKETRIKQNISNGTETRRSIKYGQYKAWEFDAEQSCEGCLDTDKVTIVNAALLGIIDIAGRMPEAIGKPLLTRLNRAIQDLNPKYQDSLYLTDEVGKILFKGTHPGSINWLFDNLFLVPDAWADALLPPMIRMENGFAILNGKNATTDNEWYQVNTGRESMTEYVEIEKWGPREGRLFSNLSGSPIGWEPNGGWRGGDEANTLGGTDGQQFHSGIREDERLWVFQTDICRVMFAEFKEDTKVRGIPTKRFAAPFRAFQANTKFNYGFCMEYERDLLDWDACVKEDPDDDELLDFSACDIPKYKCPNGVLKLQNCQGGAPVWMSSPHFFNSPDYLREDFEGIAAPIGDEFETTLDVEPTSGIAVAIHKKIQINVPMESKEIIDMLKDVQYFRLFPIVWLDECAEVDEDNAKKIKSMIIKPMIASDAVQWSLVAFGLVGFFISAILFVFKQK